MRTPTKPLFKVYELVAIGIFVVAAAAVSRMGLIY